MSAAHLTPAALQAIFSSLESGRIAISAGYAAATLIVFEFLLTLPAEVRQMWRQKKTLVFALFTTLRYATILYQVTFSMFFFLPIHSKRRCASLIYVEQVFFIFSSASLSGIFALRTFAIYHRNWYILGILLVIAAVKVFISAIDFFVSAEIATQNPAFSQFGSCNETLTGNTARWNTASAALALLFDTIVLSLTLAKTVKTSLWRRKANLHKSYTYYILRDGLLYYFAIEILLLFTVIFNQIPTLSVRVARVVIILQTSLAPSLAQRLVLNLRTVDSKMVPPTDSQIASTSVIAPIDFAHGSIIGNIGAPLRVELDEEDSDTVEVHDLEKTDTEGLDGIQMVMIGDPNDPEYGGNDNIGFTL
ncbi:hypothetical protein BDQ12DRAFT_688119 [Crucibulum laeve]|uniref:DUF6533 domain-containing protein n=1 Tax=Crucibulum laeve TaxID=68775 RepID=A0A5C3LQS8_9AGAR|nr:hypothetical protein BDQ12DRAFT_688119 [Crucibulum laeve]